MSKKTIARIAAVQTLYWYHYNVDDTSIEELIDTIINLYQQDECVDYPELTDSGIRVKLSIKYFTQLVRWVYEHIEIINQIVSSYSHRDKLIKHLSPVLLALLRVAVAEIKYSHDIPPKVIVNEYTNIASEMLTASETGFVNSILDTIIKDLTELNYDSNISK